MVGKSSIINSIILNISLKIFHSIVYITSDYWFMVGPLSGGKMWMELGFGECARVLQDGQRFG